MGQDPPERGVDSSARQSQMLLFRLSQGTPREAGEAVLSDIRVPELCAVVLLRFHSKDDHLVPVKEGRHVVLVLREHCMRNGETMKVGRSQGTGDGE